MATIEANKEGNVAYLTNVCSGYKEYLSALSMDI